MPCYYVKTFEQNFYSLKQSPHMTSNAMLETETDWHAELHAHEQTELLFVAEGRGQVILDNRRYAMNRGDLVIINPGVYHYEDYRESRSDGHCIRLYSCCIEGFETDILPPNYLLPIGYHPVIATGAFAEDFLSVFSHMRREHDQGELWYAQVCNNLSNEVVMLTLRLLHEYYEVLSQTQSDCGMQRIRSYIAQHCCEDLTVERIASELHISRHTLQRGFRSCFGMSPIQYINRLRIERAVELMRTGKKSLQEIAYAVGFNNYSHFFSMFRKINGLSPRSYLETHG